jgi:hypothetical protein
MPLSVDAVAGHAYAAGLRGDDVAVATAIAGAESRYDPKAHNPNRSTGDNSYGLWQINMIEGTDINVAKRKRDIGITRNEELFDPKVNAHAMYVISGGGNSWNAWSTFKRGEHRKFLPEAERAAAAVAGRGGAAVAGGAPLLEASSPGVIAGERIPPGGGLIHIPPHRLTFPVLTLEGGTGPTRTLEIHALSGRVSLSASSAMELEVTIADARRTGIWRHLMPLAGVRYADFNLSVASREWGEQDGVEVFKVTLRSAGVQALRQPETGHIWSDMSPTEVLESVVRPTRMRFYGKGTPRRPQIVRLGADEAGRELAESNWEMGQRLAREEGFWFFESGGAIYFAPPSWLMERATRFPVRHMAVGEESMWNTLGFPQVRTTVDEVLSVKALVSSGTFPLPRWRGEQVRPGMVVEFSGTPGYYGEGSPGAPLPLLVTDVSWDLDAGENPVQVDAVTPIDPTPDPPDTFGAGGPGDGNLASVQEAGSTVLAASGLSGGGKGSYGYQYDSVGTRDLGKTQPGTKVLMEHLISSFKLNRASCSTYVARKVDGSSSLSVHAEGRAGDCGVPVSSAFGKSLADYLVANATLFGIQLVIWDERSWKSIRVAAGEPGWRAYTPPNGKNDNTSMHRDHVHWELCWEAARDLNERAISGAYGRPT